MEASERLEWLSDITKSDEQPPPCAYEVAIQLAKHANSKTGLAYPGLGSKIGKDNARRGAKWLRLRGWIIPIQETMGRQTTYRLVAAQHRVQPSSRGVAAQQPVMAQSSGGGVAAQQPGGSSPAAGTGSSPAPLTGNEPVMNRDLTGTDFNEAGVSTPDPLPYEQTEDGLRAAKRQAEVRADRLRSQGKA